MCIIYTCMHTCMHACMHAYIQTLPSRVSTVSRSFAKPQQPRSRFWSLDQAEGRNLTWHDLIVSEDWRIQKIKFGRPVKQAYSPCWLRTSTFEKDCLERRKLRNTSGIGVIFSSLGFKAIFYLVSRRELKSWRGIQMPHWMGSQEATKLLNYWWSFFFF